MELKTLLGKLGIENDWDMFAEIYPAAQKLYEEEGLWYLEEDFLRDCHKKYGVLGNYEETIVSAAKEIKRDKYLSAYLGILRYIVHDRKDAVKLLGTVPLPEPESEQARLRTELMPFYVFPPEAEKLNDFLCAKNMPKETVKAALAGFAGSIAGFERRHKRVGFERLYLVWCMHYAECKLLKFGALNFELKKFGGNVAYFADNDGNISVLADGVTFHKSGNLLGNPDYTDETGAFTAVLTETAEFFEGVPVENCLAVNQRVRLEKSKWRKILSNGDNVISIHIPAKTDISDPSVQKSCLEAEKRIAEAFPDYKARAFVCFSWLLDPVLSNMLSEGSKIVSFQNRYIRFPVKSSGTDVFIFLFATDERDYSKLPEKTSLELAVKEYYIEGKHIHKFGGAFFTGFQLKNGE